MDLHKIPELDLELLMASYHDLAKQLSYYFILLSFSFSFLFLFGLIIQGRSAGKCHMS